MERVICVLKNVVSQERLNRYIANRPVGNSGFEREREREIERERERERLRSEREREREREREA